jgi:hypothetical protein
VERVPVSAADIIERVLARDALDGAEVPDA